MTTISAPGDLDVTFLAAKTAAGQVRTLVGLRLSGWGLSRLTDDVSLIASELVTNAVRHAPDDQIRVTFTREPGRYCCRCGTAQMRGRCVNAGWTW